MMSRNGMSVVCGPYQLPRQDGTERDRWQAAAMIQRLTRTIVNFLMPQAGLNVILSQPVAVARIIGCRISPASTIAQSSCA